MDLVLILQVLFDMIKNNIYIIFFFLFSLSCDKISAPFTEGCLNCCGDSGNQKPIKTILIEEFTGHKCSNCPNGTRIIENIIDTYCDHVVVLACHPFNQDFTSPNESGPLATDFRTSETTEIAENFGFWGFPSALLNRINNGEFFQPFELNTEIHNLLFDENNNPIPPDLDIKISVSSGSDPIITSAPIVTSIEIEKLNELNGEYKLAVVVSEDFIVSGQYDGSELIEDYEHNHVYRSAINGTWGEPIDLTEKTIVKHYDLINPNEINDISNCTIVAYVYNNETNEIIQAAKKKIDLFEQL